MVSKKYCLKNIPRKPNQTGPFEKRNHAKQENSQNNLKYVERKLSMQENLIYEVTSFSTFFVLFLGSLDGLGECPLIGGILVDFLRFLDPRVSSEIP
jgi:hypothetical protein